MTQILRMIGINRWRLIEDLEPSKRPPAPADILVDFRTSGNELSFWKIDDVLIMDRVITALAAEREKTSVFDYLLFDETVFDQSDIPIDLDSNGKTPDPYVNTLHVAVKELTVDKLSNFAVCTWISPNSFINRVPLKDITSRIKKSLDDGYLIEKNMNQSLLDQLNRTSPN